MCAGTGVRHSEFNHSKTNPAHLLQIWILPDNAGYPPSYGQKSFKEVLLRENLVLAVSPEGPIVCHQKMKLYIASWNEKRSHSYEMGPERNAWVQMVRGELKINAKVLAPGDGLAINGEKVLHFESSNQAEFVFFDLP